MPRFSESSIDEIIAAITGDATNLQTLSDAVQATAGEFTQTEADALYLAIDGTADEADLLSAAALADEAGVIRPLVDAVVADATALSTLDVALGTGELTAGLNALLLYLDIDPAVLVDEDGNPLTDDNGNLIIG